MFTKGLHNKHLLHIKTKYNTRILFDAIRIGTRLVDDVVLVMVGFLMTSHGSDVRVMRGHEVDVIIEVDVYHVIVLARLEPA